MFSLRNISKQFSIDSVTINVLKDVSLDLKPGEITGLVGPSGAGKSTLLHIAGLLEKPSSGQVLIDGMNMVERSEKAKARFRNTSIGFVYQSHRLLADFSALENVMLPLLIAGVGSLQAKKEALVLLERVGLGARLDHRPAKLSGGEQQRVALARALIGRPTILLADEPTGNLDTQTSQVVFQLLLEIVKSHNVGALIATHNPDLAKQMDRVVSLKDGHIV
ncbi:MAG: ABC transporter ATP-binding protein [Alphaproteobacteria bacterium]|nr:ABC transporter ATP-binding protein [Alphaproteobacteria bacterium]OJV45102.1 MAG: ABC transporter [Alphaproteobacteria bacterium 43-37]